MNEKSKNNDKFYLQLFLLSITFLICGFVRTILANKVKKVMASEINGLMDNYALYELYENGDAMDLIVDLNLELTINNSDFSGISSIYLLTTDFVITNIEELTFGTDLSASIYIVDNELSEDGFDIVYDYIDFNFSYMVKSKAIMVPNQYVSEFDNLLELYTYSSDNHVYPLSDIVLKVTESSEQYSLIDNIVPFKEILRLGTNWYIYYYGTYNQGYYEGFDEGYNQALSLNDSELSYMGRLFKTIGGSLKSMLGVKIIGEITIGNIVFVPLFFGVLILLWKMIGKG